MSNTQYGRGKDAAGATDAIAQFNASQLQGVAGRNVDRSNVAAAGNLTNEQNRINANTDTRNKEQSFNKGLYQQDFQNQIQRAGGVASGYNNMSNLNSQQANATANMYGQIGSGISKGLLSMPSSAPAAGTPVNQAGLDTDNDLYTQQAKRSGGPF